MTLPNLAGGSLYFTVPALMLLLQANTPVDVISQIERTGLLGAALFAVSVLWKTRREEQAKKEVQLDAKDAQIATKDAQLFSMIEHTVASMTAQVETNRELRKIIEDSVKAKTELTSAIERLSDGLVALPCVRVPEVPKR